MAGLIHVGAWDGREYVGSSRRLILFEPQARPFAQLTTNLGGQAGVVLVNAAAGATPGTLTMYWLDPDHSSSLIPPPSSVVVGEESVRVTTVDDELADQGLEGTYDVMCVDTQGYELEVLKGAQRTLESLRHVECELHDTNTYPGAATVEQLDELLFNAGFERVDLTARVGDDPVAVYERG